MNFATFSSGYVLRHFCSTLHALQDDADFSQENAASFSEPHGFCIAVKKRDAKLILQILDLPAQRRLRHVKPQGRVRYVLLFGDSDEVSQMTKFHLRHYTQSVWRAKQQGISAVSALKI
jgi:hypothetical protein